MKFGFARFATAGLLAFMATAASAQVATVDGVGGASTGDARYPTSYATVNDALTAVKLVANDVAPGNTIRITAATVTETAGLLINPLENLTIESTNANGTHLKITPTGIALGSATAAVVVSQRTGKTITLDNLIITPGEGAAGMVDSRAMQVYNATADTTGAILNVEDCVFTAIRPTGHSQANQPVLNPFVHAASANTQAARAADLRSFSGGGANNAIELRQNSAPAPAGSTVTWNFTRTYITHMLLTGAEAAKGGGIVVSRTAEFTLNINEGCVISFNSGSGVRSVGTAASTGTFNVNGTAANPVFFLENGWMEPLAANTARGEGVQFGSNGATTFNYAYFIGNYHEGLDRTGAGTLTINNSYFAENQKDKDTTVGTAPDTQNFSNLRVGDAGTALTATVNNSTIYNNLAPTNDYGITFGGAIAGSALTLSNVIVAGAGDQVLLGTAAPPLAYTYTETNTAIVQAGPDALQTPFITVTSPGTETTPGGQYRVTADPEFVSTAFAPVFTTRGSAPSGLTNYLRVGTAAAAGAYNASRTSGAANIVGANAGATSVQDWSTY